MDFLPPPMSLPLVERLRAFMEQHVFPAEPAMHDSSISLTELMRPIQAAAREEGLWMPQIPEEQGGMGLSLLEHAIV
ncbi:MAG: acyl-CoA dehydrogenase family protein, partial [Nannocystaceae bacterium]